MARVSHRAEAEHEALVAKAFAIFPGTTIARRGAAIVADTGDPRMKARFRRTSARSWVTELAFPDGSWAQDERGELATVLTQLVAAWRENRLESPGARRARVAGLKGAQPILASYLALHTDALREALARLQPRGASCLLLEFDSMDWWNGIAVVVHELDADDCWVRRVGTLLGKVRRGPYAVLEAAGFDPDDAAPAVRRAFVAWFAKSWEVAAGHVEVAAYLQEHEGSRK